MSAEQYLQEIGKAADDLGYGIVRVEPDSVVLIPDKHPNVTIRIETEYLRVTGEDLRRYLRPQEDPT